MASIRLTQFSSPHRHLIRIDHGSSQQFTCDLCQTRGSGSHYRCQPCNISLHDNCAAQFRLPQMIRFFAHPWHDLSLQRGHDRFCDLCKMPAGGIFYRCTSCGFDVHPNCTTTKQVVQTLLHEHPLCLVPGVPICNMCHTLKGFWLYRCGICNFSLHIECLHAPPASFHSGQSSTAGMAPVVLQHSISMPAPGPPHHSSSNLGRLENILAHLGIRLGYDITVDLIGDIILNLLTNN